ncbi:hypothetical protein ONZ45_g13552 [Pleurotus djamor]|nr:hypothetical protein ONZ45_g13552 [Pleurotus djamor]
MTYERMTTRKNNQRSHPGEIHNRYTTKRRTAEEIEHDQSAKLQAQLLAKEEAMRRNKEKIDAIAALEASSRAGYQAKESSAARPDLYMERDDYETNPEMLLEDLDGTGDRENSEPLSIPNDGWDDGDNDGNYVPPESHQNSDVEEETFATRSKVARHSDDEISDDSDAALFKQVPIKRKSGGSKVEARAAFRAMVSERFHRDTPMEVTLGGEENATARGKRKMNVDVADDDITVPDGSAAKRNRSAAVAGGKPAKPRGASNHPQDRATIPISVNVDEEPFARTKGIRDADHDIHAIEAPTHGLNPKAATARPSAGTPAARSTSQMGIALTVAKPKTQSSTSANAKQAKREPYTTASLPFDRNRAGADMKIWKGRILPLMFNWAGSLRKPFSANSHPQFETVIMDLWRQNLPHVGDEAEHEAIRDVAGTALRTWRSSFGKTALKVIREYFAGLGQEEIKEEVKGLLLNIKDGSSRFLYKYPDEEEGYRAAWLSPLILATFACHMNRTIKIKEDESTYPVGALALTAVAVERALGNWKTGVEVNNQFSDNEWGGKAARYMRSTMAISSEKWRDIMVAVSPYVSKRGSAAEDDDSDEENEQLYITDSRANIRD